MPPGLYLTPAELCARWTIDRRTLNKLFGSQLPVVKITARTWRIHRKDVERYELLQRIGQHRGA